MNEFSRLLENSFFLCLSFSIQSFQNFLLPCTSNVILALTQTHTLNLVSEITENSEAVYDVSSLMRLLASSSIEWPEGGGIESK